MKSLISKIFRKSGEEGEQEYVVDRTKPQRFSLKVDDLEIGQLESKDGMWVFRYSEEFRNQQHYRRLTGFSDLHKEYRSEELWPFFKTRIPGLKQPMILEILERENIDKTNEVMLLKRFGKSTMTNPYILEAS